MFITIDNFTVPFFCTPIYRTSNSMMTIGNAIGIFIQFNVPFKIISLKETRQSVGEAKRQYPGKTT